jgi:hypothetical protein
MSTCIAHFSLIFDLNKATQAIDLKPFLYACELNAAEAGA